MNHFHVTSVLSACEKRGKWDLALQLLEDTQRHLVPRSTRSKGTMVAMSYGMQFKCYALG